METATTLTGLLQAVAKQFPSRRAISVAGKLDLTHSHLNQLVESAANHLISVGIKPNDVVGLTFPNTVEVRFRTKFFHQFYCLFVFLDNICMKFIRIL
jgi:acyl-CoA synthetase (AMP-forming)/AMP-acid ligase II